MYVGKTTFFLRYIISIKHGTFDFFSHFSNLIKPEIAGIGILKGLQVAVCGMSYIDLNNVEK